MFENHHLTPEYREKLAHLQASRNPAAARDVPMTNLDFAEHLMAWSPSISYHTYMYTSSVLVLEMKCLLQRMYHMIIWSYAVYDKPLYQKVISVNIVTILTHSNTVTGRTFFGEDDQKLRT